MMSSDTTEKTSPHVLPSLPYADKGTGRQDLSRELLPATAPTTIILFPSF